MDAREYFDAGQLTEAIDAALANVKKKPSDIDARAFLCELLCFTGDIERADKQLDTLSDLAPEAMVGVALFRQLIRAEMSRREFYDAGRVPEFVGLPTESQKLCLEASIRLRENEPALAAELLEKAELRPTVAGKCDGNEFEDWRDLDDLLSPTFEVLTTTGKYFWIPVERVDSIEFRAPEHVRDLLWRPAHMVVQDGPDGEVYLPAIYAGSHSGADDKIKLGRATDWLGDESGPVSGIGQRMFLVGESDESIMQLKQVEFSS